MGKIKKIKAERKRAEVELKLKKIKTRKLYLKVVFLVAIGVGLFGGGYLGYKALVVKYPKLKIAWNKKEENKTRSGKVYDKAPEMNIDTSKKYLAKMETNKGIIELELDPKETPKTVNNFVFLAREGFYDGVKFHRMVKDFMIQGGDPAGTGSGGPGYKFDDEKFTADYVPGTVAMANSGPNTNGSQFFIMTGDYSGGKLPKNYTIFGKVVSGMDVVQKIAAIPTVDNGQGEQSKPTEEVKINKISITEK